MWSGFQWEDDCGKAEVSIFQHGTDEIYYSRYVFSAFAWGFGGNPDSAFFCLIVMVIRKESGFFMVFYLAALQQLSPELREAGLVEGAGGWYYFIRVTFPLLMPTTLFVTVNAVVNSFKLVDHLVIMTKGGPDNASFLLLYYIYL